jgi:primase-polymerase (primpol)-like protein
MTADIVNLRRARKSKARTEREKQAADNRLAFGRSKSEKTLAKSERDLALKAIEGHRREPDKT